MGKFGLKIVKWDNSNGKATGSWDGLLLGIKRSCTFLACMRQLHSTGKLPMGLSRANLRDFAARITKGNAIYFQIRNQIAEKKFSHLCSQCCPVALRDTLEEEEEQGKR